ncbi:MAG: lipoyl(octanoyl) transferase LipB [Dysgonamonadaceae bacterium]|nr:lipoyl(octanoyl) transferase LipB [Dysgonamonadaceae bacterium]
MESMISYTDWGLIPYSEAYEKQKRLFESAIEKKNQGEKPENTLIFCEHPHVITIGKNGLSSNLLFPEQRLKEKQVELFHVDRGGDVTYHGQGQLVGYPVFDLENFKLGLKDYIFRMEECIIKLLETYNIRSERLEGATGVWIDTDKPGKTRKICAIGVKSSRYVTMHGFALNVNTDLAYFQLINPCGFVDKGVTSMEKELQKPIDFEEVKDRLLKLFQDYFQ